MDQLIAGKLHFNASSTDLADVLQVSMFTPISSYSLCIDYYETAFPVSSHPHSTSPKEDSSGRHGLAD
jgi:hypothetical protein